MPDTVDIRLSIIITVFSETVSLVETIDRLLAGDRGYILEILLVVSPRSSAPCLEVCRELAARHALVRFYLQKNNPGVGRAIREGLATVTGTHMAIMSADLETEPEAVDRMVRAVEASGHDLVIANRWLPGGGFENYNPVKLWLNWLFQNIFKRIYGTELGDLTYGLKIIKKDQAAAICWEATHHEIFIETTLKPLLARASAGQVPTVWIGRREGVSKNSFFINLRYTWLALKLTRQIPAARRVKCHRKD
ncbi:MAG: glycosyltransferase family 2 protein [Desulfosudaceae bacterium]